MTIFVDVINCINSGTTQFDTSVDRVRCEVIFLFRISTQTSFAMRSLVVLLAMVAVAVGAPHVEKRSVAVPLAYAAVPAAVSHQSRVDIRSSPAVVAAAPVSYVAEPVVARAVYAAPASTVYVGGAAVSHQSRVDLQSSPAVVTQQLVAPAVVEARSVYAPSIYAW